MTDESEFRRGRREGGGRRDGEVDCCGGRRWLSAPAPCILLARKASSWDFVGLWRFELSCGGGTFSPLRGAGPDCPGTGRRDGGCWEEPDVPLPTAFSSRVRDACVRRMC